MVNKVQITDNLSADIKTVLEPLGGISAFIKEGEKVFIKPNFNTSDPFPASSDMNFIRTVIQLVLSQNPKEIILGDAPTIFGNSKKYFEEKNPRELEKEFKNVKVIFLKEDTWERKKNTQAKYLKYASIPKILSQVDKIIYLPCLKTHSWAQFTGALKLSVGILKPAERIRMHSGHLQEKIAELNLLVKPDLIIMDGRKCFIDHGPSEGSVKEPKIILASTNRVEIDIEAIKIIQTFPGNSLANLNPNEIPQIKYATGLGIL